MKVTPEKKELAKHNFMFMGVCTAALFVIPALASIAIKPFMNKIQGDKKTESKQKLDIKENEVPEKPNVVSIHDPHEYTTPFHPISINNYVTPKISGMKVGAPW